MNRLGILNSPLNLCRIHRRRRCGICGSLRQAILGCSPGGCLVSIALGFVGASFWNVARADDGIAGAVSGADWWNQLSHCVIVWVRALSENSPTLNQ
jgi:uncharacterized membrane protein YeaQ/YmgE (transglycosylase-associated protein family)